MAWGWMRGLGRGLEQSAQLPQQVYQNKRQTRLDESTLESQALTRALARSGEERAIAGESRLAELHPLQVTGAREAIETADAAQAASKSARAREIMQANLDTGRPIDDAGRAFLTENGYGGAIGPDGLINLSRAIQAEKDQALKQSQAVSAAATSNAASHARQVDIQAAESPSTIAVREAQAEAYRTGKNTAADARRDALLLKAAESGEVKAILRQMEDLTPNDTRGREALSQLLNQKKLEAIVAAGGAMGLPQAEIDAALDAQRKAATMFDPPVLPGFKRDPITGEPMAPVIRGKTGPVVNPGTGRSGSGGNSIYQ